MRTKLSIKKNDISMNEFPFYCQYASLNVRFSKHLGVHIKFHDAMNGGLF